MLDGDDPEAGFQARLRQLRDSTKTSARGLDKMAGLDGNHVRFIEKRRGVTGRVSARTVAKLAAVFGVSMDWLYLGVGKPPTKMAMGVSIGKAKAAVEAAKRLSEQTNGVHTP